MFIISVKKAGERVASSSPYTDKWTTNFIGTQLISYVGRSRGIVTLKGLN